MHPILFRLPEWLPLIGGFPLRSFSAMVLLGVLMAAFYLRRALARQGVTAEGALDHLVRNALIFGFIGARVTYLIVHPEHYQDLLDLVAVWRGGIVSYGGFIGGAFGAWLFARRWKIPFARLGDALGPALALGQVFGRIGCFLVGDDHGRPWNGPLAVTFRSVGVTADGQKIPKEGSLIPPELLDVPLHPAQLYLSAMNLALFVTLALLYRRRRFDGQVMAATLVLYAIGRFTVEFTRGDDEARGVYGAFSTSQWISLAVFVAGVLCWLRFRGRPVTSGFVPPVRHAKVAREDGAA